LGSQSISHRKFLLTIQAQRDPKLGSQNVASALA
jgi:hypothetical protein